MTTEVTVQSLQVKWKNLLAEKRAGAHEARLVELLSKDIAVDFPLLCRDLHGSNFEAIFGDGETLFHLLCFSVKYLQVSLSPTSAVTNVENLQLIMLISMILEPTAHSQDKHFALFERYLSHAVQSDLPAVLVKNVKSFFELLAANALFVSHNEDQQSESSSAASPVATTTPNNNNSNMMPKIEGEEEVSIRREITSKLRHFRTLESERSVQDLLQRYDRDYLSPSPSSPDGGDRSSDANNNNNNDSNNLDIEDESTTTMMLDKRRISSVSLRFVVRNLNSLQSLLSPQSVSVHEDVRSVIAENLIALSSAFTSLMKLDNHHTSLAPSISKQLHQVLNNSLCRFPFPPPSRNSDAPAHEVLDASVVTIKRCFTQAHKEFTQDKNAFICRRQPTEDDLNKQKDVIQNRLDVLVFATKSLRSILSCALSTKPMPVDVFKMRFPELIDAVTATIQATASLTVISDEYFHQSEFGSSGGHHHHNNSRRDRSASVDSTTSSMLGRSMSSQLLATPASPNVVGSPSSHRPPTVAAKIFNDNIDALLHALVFVAVSPNNDDTSSNYSSPDDSGNLNSEQFSSSVAMSLTSRGNDGGYYSSGSSSAISGGGASTSSQQQARTTLQHDEFGRPVSNQAEEPLFARGGQFDRRGARRSPQPNNINNNNIVKPKIVVSSSDNNNNQQPPPLEKEASSGGFFSKIGKSIGKVVDAITNKDDDKKNANNNTSNNQNNNNNSANNYYDDEQQRQKYFADQMRVQATKIAFLQNHNGTIVTVPGILWAMTELIVKKIGESLELGDQSNTSIHTFAYYQLQNAAERIANKLFDWLGSISVGELSWTLRSQLLFYLLDHSNKLSSRLQVSLITSITILVESCSSLTTRGLSPGVAAAAARSPLSAFASGESLSAVIHNSNAITTGNANSNNNNTNSHSPTTTNEVANIVMKLAALLSPKDLWLTYDGASATIMLFNSIIRGLGGDQHLARDLIRAGFQVVLTIIEHYISSDEDVACFRIDSALPGAVTDHDTKKRHNATLFALLSEFWSLLLSSIESEHKSSSSSNNNNSNSLSSYCDAEKAVEVFLSCSNSPHGITTSSSARNMLRALVAKYPRSNIHLVSFLKLQLKKAYEEDDEEHRKEKDAENQLFNINNNNMMNTNNIALDGTVRRRLSTTVNNVVDAALPSPLQKDATAAFTKQIASKDENQSADRDDEYDNNNDNDNDDHDCTEDTNNNTRNNTMMAEEVDMAGLYATRKIIHRHQETDEEEGEEEEDEEQEEQQEETKTPQKQQGNSASSPEEAGSPDNNNNNDHATPMTYNNRNDSVLTVDQNDALSQSVLSVASVLVDTRDGAANISYFLQEGGMQIAIDIFVFIVRSHNHESTQSERLRPVSLLLSMLVPHVRFNTEPFSLSSMLINAMRKYKGIEKSVTATQLLIDLVTLQLTVDGGDRILKWIERRLDPEDYQMRLARLEKEGGLVSQSPISPRNKSTTSNDEATPLQIRKVGSSPRSSSFSGSSILVGTGATKQTVDDTNTNNSNNNKKDTEKTTTTTTVTSITHNSNSIITRYHQSAAERSLLPNRPIGPFFLRDSIDDHNEGPTQLTLCLVPDLFQELLQWYDHVANLKSANTNGTSNNNNNNTQQPQQAPERSASNMTLTPMASPMTSFAREATMGMSTASFSTASQQPLFSNVASSSTTSIPPTSSSSPPPSSSSFGIDTHLSSLLAIITEITEKFLVIPSSHFALFAARRNLPHQLLPKSIMNDAVIVNHILKNPPTRSIGISRALESARFSIRCQAMHLVGPNALVSGDVETNFPTRDGWSLSAWWRWTFDGRFSHHQMMAGADNSSPDAQSILNAKRHNSKHESKFGIRLFEFSWKAPITGRRCSVVATAWPHVVSSTTPQQNETAASSVTPPTTTTPSNTHPTQSQFPSTTMMNPNNFTSTNTLKSQQQQQSQNQSSSSSNGLAATRLELILSFGGSEVVKENFILPDSSNNWIHLVFSRIRSKEQARLRAPGEFLVLYRDGVRVPQYQPPLNALSPSTANDITQQERQAEILQELEKYFDESVSDRNHTTKLKLDIGMGLSKQNEFDLRTLRFTNLNLIGKPITIGSAVALYSQRFVSPPCARASLHTSAHRASDLILHTVLSENAVRAASAWCRSNININLNENNLPPCYETQIDDFIVSLHPALAMRQTIPRVGEDFESRQWALVNLAGTRRKPRDPFVLKGYHSIPTVNRYEFCHRAICLGGMETLVRWLHDAIREEVADDIVKVLRVLSLISLRVDFARCTDRTLWMQTAKAMSKAHLNRRIVHAVLDGCFVDLDSGDFITCEEDLSGLSSLSNHRSPNKTRHDQATPSYENAAVCNVALIEQGLLQWSTTAHKPEFVGEEITRALTQLLSEKNPYCKFNANRLYRSQLMLHLTHGVARYCLAQSTMFSCGRVMSSALRCGGDWLRLSISRLLAFVMLTVPHNGDEDAIKARLFTVMPVRGYLETHRNIVLRSFVDALAQFPNDKVNFSQQQEKDFYEGNMNNNNNNNNQGPFMSPLLAAMIQRFPPWLIAFLIGPDSSAETAALALRLFERFVLSASYRNWCHSDNSVFYTSLATRLPAFARSKDILAIITRLALGAKPTCYAQPYDFLAPNVAVSGNWVKNTFGQPIVVREFMPLLWMMLDQLLMYHNNLVEQQQQTTPGSPSTTVMSPSMSPTSSNLKQQTAAAANSSTSLPTKISPLIAASLKNYFDSISQQGNASMIRKFKAAAIIVRLTICLCKQYSVYKSASSIYVQQQAKKNNIENGDDDDDDDDTFAPQESVVLNQMNMDDSNSNFDIVPPPRMQRRTTQTPSMGLDEMVIDQQQTKTSSTPVTLSRQNSFAGSTSSHQSLFFDQQQQQRSRNTSQATSSSINAPNALEIVQRITSLCVTQCNYHPEIVESLLEFSPSGTQPTLDAITRAMFTSAKHLVRHVTPTVSSTTPCDEAKLIAFEEQKMVIPLCAAAEEKGDSSSSNIHLNDIPPPLQYRHFHLSDASVQHIQADDDPLFSTTLQLLAKVIDGSLMMMTTNASFLSASSNLISSPLTLGAVGDRLESFFAASFENSNTNNNNSDRSAIPQHSQASGHPNSVTVVIHYLLARMRMFGSWNVAPSPAISCMISLLIKTSIKTVFQRFSKLVKQRIDSGETKRGPVSQMILPVAISCLQLAKYLAERFTAGMLVPAQELFQFLTDFIADITPLALLSSSTSEFSQMRKKAQALLFDCALYISSSSFHRYSRLLLAQSREILSQFGRQIFMTFSTSAGNKKEFTSDESAAQLYNTAAQTDYLKKFIPRVLELSFDALFEDASPSGRRQAGEIWFALHNGPLGGNSQGFQNVITIIKDNCVSSANLDFKTAFKMFSEDKNLGADFFMDWLDDKRPYIAFGTRAAFQIYCNGPLRLDTCNPRQHALDVYRLSSTIMQEQQHYMAETAAFTSVNALKTDSNFNKSNKSSFKNNNNNLNFASVPGSAEYAILSKNSMMLNNSVNSATGSFNNYQPQQDQQDSSSSPAASPKLKQQQSSGSTAGAATAATSSSASATSSNRKIRDRDQWIERNRTRQLDQATWVDPAVVCLRANAKNAATGEHYFSDKGFAAYHRAVRGAIPLDVEGLALCYDADTGLVYRSKPPPTSSLSSSNNTNTSSGNNNGKKSTNNNTQQDFLYSVGTQDRIGIPFPALTTYVGGGASPFEARMIHLMPSYHAQSGFSSSNTNKASASGNAAAGGGMSANSSSSAMDQMQSSSSTKDNSNSGSTDYHQPGNSFGAGGILSSASRRLAVRLFSDERAEPLFASNVYVISGQDYLICVMIVTNNEVILISHCTLTAAGDLQIAPQKEHTAEMEQKQASSGSLREMFNKWVMPSKRQQQLESNATHNFSQVFRESRARAAMQKQPLAKIWRFNTNWISHVRHRHFHHQNVGLELVLDGGSKWFVVVLETDFTMSTKLRDECGEVLKSVHTRNLHHHHQSNNKDSSNNAVLAASRNQHFSHHHRNNYCTHFIPVFDDTLMRESRKKMKDLWLKRQISNFAYLLALNDYGSRTSADVTQYPVFPWVITEYNSSTLDLSSSSSYRDLSRPAGALNPKKAEELEMRFKEWPDPDTVPFHHGTHYSTSAIVMYYLVRFQPFLDMHKTYQGGKVDKAERLFHSVPDAFTSVMSGRGDVKELIAEWFVNGDIFTHTGVDLGKKQDGTTLGAVVLPPWAGNSPHRFVALQRLALESSLVTQHLPDWLDLIFGQKQQGEFAEKALNVFMRSTYESGLTAAMTEFESPAECAVFVAQVRDFGLTPRMFMKNLHPRSPSLPILPRQQQFLSRFAQNRFAPVGPESFTLFQNANDFASDLRLAGASATFPAALAGSSEGSLVEILPNFTSSGSSSSGGGGSSNLFSNPVAAAASSFISGISFAANNPSASSSSSGISNSASAAAHQALCSNTGSCTIIANSRYYVLLGNQAPFSWLVFDGYFGVSVHTFTSDPQSGQAYEQCLFRFPSTFAYGCGVLTHMSANTSGSVVCLGASSGVIFIYRRDVRDDVYSYQLSQILQPPRPFNPNSSSSSSNHHNQNTNNHNQQRTANTNNNYQRAPSQQSATTAFSAQQQQHHHTTANNHNNYGASSVASTAAAKYQQNQTNNNNNNTNRPPTTTSSSSSDPYNANRITMMKFLKDQVLAIVFDKTQLVIWMCTVQRVEFIWECNLALLAQTTTCAVDRSPIVAVSSIHIGHYWHRLIVAQERSLYSFSPRGVLLARMSLDPAPPPPSPSVPFTPTTSAQTQYLQPNSTNMMNNNSTYVKAHSYHHTDPNKDHHFEEPHNQLLQHPTSSMVSRRTSFSYAGANPHLQLQNQHQNHGMIETSSSSSLNGGDREIQPQHKNNSSSSAPPPLPQVSTITAAATFSSPTSGRETPQNPNIEPSSTLTAASQQAVAASSPNQQLQLPNINVNNNNSIMASSTTTSASPITPTATSINVTAPPTPMTSAAVPPPPTPSSSASPILSASTTNTSQTQQQQSQNYQQYTNQMQQQPAANTLPQSIAQEAMTSTAANLPRSNITAMIALSMPTYSSKGEVILCGHADGSLSTWQLELDHHSYQQQQNSNNNDNSTMSKDENHKNLNHRQHNCQLIECFRFVSSVGAHVPANLRASAVQSESATKVTALSTNVGIVPIKEFLIVVAFGDRQVQVLTSAMKE